jgi:5'-methylthioadenosine phosphorylase
MIDAGSAGTTAAPSAEIGVIGGSGLYRLLDGAEEVAVDTRWGEPSDRLAVAELAGRRVAFLPRHGSAHTIPPHRINYRANIDALHSLGVRRIIAPCAVGSLRAEHAPGSIVVVDQFVDRTSGRRDTFFDGPEVVHLSAAHPYCAQLRPLAVRAASDAGLPARDGGTVVVVNGPRFGTRAESRMHAALGFDVVNMTQYPEAALARERGMCYVALALVTDYDSGLEDDDSVQPVTAEAVFRLFERSTDALRDALLRLVAAVPVDRTCACGPAPRALAH